MAVRFNRVAGVSQYGTTPVDVPLHILDESLGAVRLWLRELPAGLAKELDDRAKELEDPIEVIKEIVQWGVTGHDPNDFLEETSSGLVPIPYQSTEAQYHGHTWPVAHPDTVAMYQRALPKGLFLHSIRAVLAWYQGGIVPTPRQIWDSAKPKKEPRPLEPEQDQKT